MKCKSFQSFLLAGWLLWAACASCETIFPARDLTENGDPISWVGSRTVFVGRYTWPDREPIGIYNDGAQLVARADLVISNCDLAADSCSTSTSLPFGGLPKGAEVKFVTTGLLPGGLVAWSADHAKVYYIREWTGNSFKVSATPDGPPIHFDKNVRGSGTHGMSFAGYMQAIAFHIARAVRVSCDPQTSICTSEQPHQYGEGAWVYLYSDGKLPDGLYEFGAGKIYAYCFAYLSPTTFKLRETDPALDTPCTDKLRYAKVGSAGRGTHYMFGLHLPGKSDPAASNLPTYVQKVSGYPTGTVLSWRGWQSVQKPIPTFNGYGTTDPGGFTVAMFAKVPANTPPGRYRITVETSESKNEAKNPASFQYTVEAVDLPRTQIAEPKTFPKIPGMDKWTRVMTSSLDGGGAALSMYPRCANRKDAQAPLGWADDKGVVTLSNTGTPYPVMFTPGANARVWFYNDETFFRIAEFTGDPSWVNCGVFVAAAMRDKYQQYGPKAMPGYFYFPWTMVAAYRATKDPSFKEQTIATADAGTNSVGSITDTGMRENAFAFEGRLAKQYLTGEDDPALQYYAEATLAQLFVNATGRPDRVFMEPFMAGLAMRPLIRWYLISHDERVPYVIKLVLDTAWDKWYSQSAHHLYYNTEPAGQRCSIGCLHYTSSKLNNLVAPAYAWYWRLTGDELVRQRGDDMFAHQYDDGYPYSAKEWSQGYYWSWDFVDWRQGKKSAR